MKPPRRRSLCSTPCRQTIYGSRLWAIAGAILKLSFPGRFDRISIWLYLATGGALYTLGVLFHSWELLRFQNAIWHGVVLVGAGCDFTAVAGSKSFRPLTQQHPHRFMTRSPE